jgi:hypothetical protein
MKLKATIYKSPDLFQGTFENVFIEDVSFELKRQEKYLRINFDMYYIKNEQKIILESNYIAFQGMNGDYNSTNRKATFRFNAPPIEEEIPNKSGSETEAPEIDPTELPSDPGTPTEEPVYGMIDYVMEHGEYPTDYTMVDWGYASFEDALTYLSGGSFQEPELQPVNDFVKGWILNTIVMKNEYIINQFQFI